MPLGADDRKKVAKNAGLYWPTAGEATSPSCRWPLRIAFYPKDPRHKAGGRGGEPGVLYAAHDDRVSGPDRSI